MPVDRLIDVLRGTHSAGLSRMQASQALRFPWCRPLAPELLAATRTFSVTPDVAKPGEALLVSVPATGPGASLWCLRPQDTSKVPGALTFVNEARRGLQRATVHALRSLPLVRSMRPLRSYPWCAERIVRHGQREREAVLDGASFGLSMCLAVASKFLDIPLPTTLAATCEVDSCGNTAPVQDHGLEAKVDVLAGEALGVTQLLLHPSQRDQAQRIAQSIRGDLECIGVRSVGEAVRHAFPDLTERISSWWADASDARRSANELFRAVVEERVIILEWRAVAAAAERLMSVLEGDPRSYLRAGIARAVARRHCGEVAPLDWPDDSWLRAERRPLRQRLVANVVQSAIDNASAHTAALAARALATVPAEGDEHPEDLMVLGAVGRALAGLERYADATDNLRRAVRGWLELGRVADASYALCELLRVEGILATDDDAEIRAAARGRLEATVNEHALVLLEDPEVSRASAAFVQAGVERALLLAGDAPTSLAFEARTTTEPIDWLAEVPRHLAITRGRWRARALEAVGQHDEAAVVRAQVLSLCAEDPTDRELALLTLLDEARTAGEPVEELVADLQNQPAVAPIAVTGLTTDEIARRYADCSRY